MATRKAAQKKKAEGENAEVPSIAEAFYLIVNQRLRGEITLEAAEVAVVDLYEDAADSLDETHKPQLAAQHKDALRANLRSHVAQVTSIAQRLIVSF